MTHKLRMGMVGGGIGAMIGPVHRMAAQLDGEIVMVAGALSSTPEKSLRSARDIGLPEDRSYPDWGAMLETERKRGDDRLDFVTIVTPNVTHFDIARAFVDAGFNIVIDKPMVATNEQADELSSLVEARGVHCCVTYSYTGYPMVKHARAMVHGGELGEIRKVHVTYHQGWLAQPIEDDGNKQASWRTDPSLAGAGGAVSDIGSHAENLAGYVTGLELDSIAAQLNSFVGGREVDDDANVMLRFKGGAAGVLVASQICIGSDNDLRISVHGSKGSLHWRQESPHELHVMTAGEPVRTFHAGGSKLGGAAQAACRLPAGHPEGVIEAFANLYRSFAATIRGESAGGPEPDFPDARVGARGVHFINAAVKSSEQGGAWMKLE